MEQTHKDGNYFILTYLISYQKTNGNLENSIYYLNISQRENILRGNERKQERNASGAEEQKVNTTTRHVQ